LNREREAQRDDGEREERKVQARKNGRKKKHLLEKGRPASSHYLPQRKEKGEKGGLGRSPNIEKGNCDRSDTFHGRRIKREIPRKQQGRKKRVGTGSALPKGRGKCMDGVFSLRECQKRPKEKTYHHC